MMMRNRQRGFSLVSTLFVLVVLAALGGYMSRLNNAQHTSSALVSQSSRARFAALSGLDWAIYQVRVNGADCSSIGPPPALEGFSLSLSRCVSYPVTEGATSYTLHDIEVTASRSSLGLSDHVRRQVRATVRS